MSTHDDFRTDEELEECGYERVDNRVKRKSGHQELVTDDGVTQVYRWVLDE